MGGHAVKIVGWGVDEVKGPLGILTRKVPYWLVANSWSVQWGLEGFFISRMRRNA